MVGFDLAQSLASYHGLGWMRNLPGQIGTQQSFLNPISSPSLAKKLGCFALVADTGSRGGKTRGGQNMSKGDLKLNPQRVSYHVNDGVQLVGDAWGASDAAPVLLLEALRKPALAKSLI